MNRLGISFKIFYDFGSSNKTTFTRYLKVLKINENLQKKHITKPFNTH